VDKTHKSKRNELKAGEKDPSGSQKAHGTKSIKYRIKNKLANPQCECNKPPSEDDSKICPQYHKLTQQVLKSNYPAGLGVYGLNGYRSISTKELNSVEITI
jgi:hypothetical protein